MWVSPYWVLRTTCSSAYAKITVESYWHNAILPSDLFDNHEELEMRLAWPRTFLEVQGEDDEQVDANFSPIS